MLLDGEYIPDAPNDGKTYVLSRTRDGWVWTELGKT